MTIASNCAEEKSVGMKVAGKREPGKKRGRNIRKQQNGGV